MSLKVPVNYNRLFFSNKIVTPSKKLNTLRLENFSFVVYR